MSVVGLTGLTSGEKLGALSAHVYVSTSWWGPWTEDPYLTPLRWSHKIAPEIPQAAFLYRYGDKIAHEGHHAYSEYPPIDIGNYFVRIQTRGAGASEEIWQGFITDMSLQPTGRPGGSGEQIITAYGLECFLQDRARIIRTAWVRPDPRRDDIVEVDCVPGFNQSADKGSGLSSSNPFYGNMGTLTVDLGARSFRIFDMGDSSEQWTADHALDVILGHHLYDLPFPLDVGGQTDTIEGLILSHGIEGMSPYDAINSILSRDRGLAWDIPHNWPDDPVIRVRSAFEADVEYTDVNGDPAVFSGNSSTYELAFDSYLDVDVDSIVFSTLKRYKSITAIGERVRSVFTGDVSERSGTAVFVPGWSEEAETAFEEVSSDLEDQSEARMECDSTRANNEDLLGKVFRFYVLNSLHDGIVGGKSVFPTIDDTTGKPLTDSHIQWPLCQGRGFMRNLPIPPFKSDTSESRSIEERPSYAIVRDGVAYDAQTEATSSCYRYLHDLSGTSYPNCGLRMADMEYGVFVHGPGEIFARNRWDEVQNDPTGQTSTTYVPVFDYTTLKFTVCAELDIRMKVKKICGLTSPFDLIENDLDLIINVPNAHCWVINPDTVTGIDASGELVLASSDATYSDNDYLIRDDSGILRSVVAFAEQWYGIDRRMLTYTMHNICTHLDVGTIITTCTTGGRTVTVNSMITSKEYDWTSGTMRISTGYADIDAVAIVTGGRQTSGSGGGSDYAGGVSIPSRSHGRCKTMLQEERIKRIEDHTRNIPCRMSGGGRNLHVHDGSDNLSLSLQRTEMQDDDDSATNRGQLGLYWDSVESLFCAVKALWG